MGNITLSNDNPVTSFSTPLKVEHAQSCSSVAPTLKLQMDTVADKTLSVGGVDIAAAVATLAAQSYAGWYVSPAGGSCDAACTALGLVCTEAEYAKHSSEVDTCEEVGAIIWSYYKRTVGDAWTWSGCAQNTLAGCCQTSTQYMPSHNTAVNAGFHRHPGGGPGSLSDYDCTTTLPQSPTNAGNPQLLCYCHAAGLSGLTNTAATGGPLQLWG